MPQKFEDSFQCEWSYKDLLHAAIGFSLLSSQRKGWNLSREGWQGQKNYVTRTLWPWALFFPFEFAAFSVWSLARVDKLRPPAAISVTIERIMFKSANGCCSDCDEQFLSLWCHLPREESDFQLALRSCCEFQDACRATISGSRVPGSPDHRSGAPSNHAPKVLKGPLKFEGGLRSKAISPGWLPPQLSNTTPL